MYFLILTLFFLNVPIYILYQREVQLNEANTSDKETSFLDLNIKLLIIIFPTAFTTNAMIFEFL